MLDINFIRENPEKVKKGVVAKGYDPKVVDKILELDKKRRELLQSIEELRKERNVAARIKDEEKGKKIKADLQKLEPKLRKLEQEFEEKLLEIPNLPAEDVKKGRDESENEVLRKWGEPRKFDFRPKDHLGVGELLDIIDVKRAAKVSGTRFGYLKKDAVLLEFALVKLAFEKLLEEGFTPIIPPVLINRDITKKLGYWQHGGHEEYFYIGHPHDFYLVGTAEHSILPYYMDEVLEGDELPKRFVGFSTCFRREAGAYGKETKGIFRVHQFDKVEMVSVTKPEESDKEHEYLLSIEEKLFQALEIPYQIVKMCTGDLGHPTARKYDLEAWMPGQGKYREVTSTSTTTDYQARRLNIKYREDNKTEFVHMLNGTAFAIGRTIIAILENFQQKDGSVVIPDILRDWVGKDKITPP